MIKYYYQKDENGEVYAMVETANDVEMTENILSSPIRLPIMGKVVNENWEVIGG